MLTANLNSPSQWRRELLLPQFIAHRQRCRQGSSAYKCRELAEPSHLPGVAAPKGGLAPPHPMDRQPSTPTPPPLFAGQWEVTSGPRIGALRRGCRPMEPASMSVVAPGEGLRFNMTLSLLLPGSWNI
jgi:hypothetical protein